VNRAEFLTPGAADGEVLAERYRIGARLRSTPLADVYAAHDAWLARPMHVAIERVEVLDDSDAAKRGSAGSSNRSAIQLLFSAAIRSALRVPLAMGLTLVHDLGELDGPNGSSRWMVAEPTPGLDVERAWLLFSGSVLERESLILQVAERLATIMLRLHAEGIIHGALGPSTVLLAGRAPSDLTVSVVDIGPRPEMMREDPARPEVTSALWRWWANAIPDPAPELLAGREPDERSDVYGFGCVIATLLSSIAIPESGWAELVQPTDAIDLGLELRRVSDQAMKRRPAERQYSFLVVTEQLAAIRSALAAEEHEPGTGLEKLEAAVASELAPELVAVLAWVSVRVPVKSMAWIPTWASLVVRVGLPVRAAAPEKRRTPFAAYRVQRARRVATTVALLVGVVAGPAALVGWVADYHHPSHALVALAPSPGITPNGGNIGRDQSTVVPSTIGTDVSYAVESLATAGLEPGLQLIERDGNNPSGAVLATSPRAGTEVTRGSVIHLTVASGFQKVPDGLIGEDQDEVTAALESAGFATRVVDRETRGYLTGYVLDVSTTSGARAEVGATLTITVAQYTGPTPTPTPTSTPPPTPTR
jgi:eukaryotic-like serine/threonine-protein kinase